MPKHLFSLAFFVGLCGNLFSQNSKPKNFFDKSGKACTEEVAYSFRQESDTANYFRSFYAVTGKLYFQGKISDASSNDESQNAYEGLCNWYYKNGNLKQSRSFDSKGLETGTSKYYYESGKPWKELEFFNGKISQRSFTEFDEDGTKNILFEENFDNNFNEWDLFMSDKSFAKIADGKLEIISTSKEGTSRYINYPIESDEYTIEASINVSDIKETDRVGIIYGFKDWQNYHYFAISKKGIYIGSFYEGVKANEVDGMYCSSINPQQDNVIKILSGGEKDYFSVNGEIQYKENRRRLYGNNVGFVLSGSAKMKAEKFVIKQINVSGNGSAKLAPSDKDVKATGSGLIFTSSGYIVTNHHVIDNSNNFVVELNKQNYKAELIVSDKENDLAILKIKDGDFKNLEQLQYAFKESGQLDVGASVFTIGYPYALSGMGKDAKFTDGKISSRMGYNGSINSFQTTIPVQPGNSGGPVFNESGQLVGVVNSSIRDADNVSYAIKLNYIKNLIEVVNDKIDLPANTSISSFSLEEKIKVLTNYVVLIKVK